MATKQKPASTRGSLAGKGSALSVAKRVTGGAKSATRSTAKNGAAKRGAATKAASKQSTAQKVSKKTKASTSKVMASKTTSRSKPPKKTGSATTKASRSGSKAPRKAASSSKASAEKKASADKAVGTAKQVVEKVSSVGHAAKEKIQEVAHEIVEAASSAVGTHASDAKTSDAKTSDAKGTAAKPTGSSITRGTTVGGVSAHPDAKISKNQLKQLHERLLEERTRVMDGMGRHLNEATTDSDLLTDEVDMAQRHTEQAYLIRFADKERKLLLEIENALEKLKIGDYGVCEGTGEPIALKRLELRPWTRYSVSYKEQLERERAQHHR